MRRSVRYLVEALPVAMGLLCLSLGLISGKSGVLGTAQARASHLPGFFLRNDDCIRIADGKISWQQISEVLPGDSSTYALVAKCHTLLTEALSQEPTDDVLWHNRAWCDRILGDRGASLRDLQTAINLSPSDPVYHSSKALFAFEDQDDAVAEGALSRTITLSPRVLGSNFISDVAVRHPDLLHAALDHASANLAIASNDPISQANLGRIALYRGDLSEADSLLQSSLQQLPNLGAAWRTYAIVKAGEGMPSDAQISAQKASFLLHRPINVEDLIDHPYTPDFEFPSPHASRFRVRFHQAYPHQNDVFPKDLLPYVSSKF
jgi:tetratricopeptide (TPR) repeat protein